MRGVKMLNSVSYRLIDDEGLHITRAEQDSCLPVDTVVICAGQEPRRELQQPLLAMGKTVHLIGGADVAAELDARRAIDQGTRLAMALKRGAQRPLVITLSDARRISPLSRSRTSCSRLPACSCRTDA